MIVGCISVTYYIYLFLGHTLEFAVEPLDTIVEPGHSAVLDCVVKQHDPNVVIQWMDQDRQVLTFIGDSYRYANSYVVIKYFFFIS